MLINGAVIAAGSCHKPQIAFERAKQHLSQLGQCQWSDVLVSPDFTQKTNRIYHNACVKLALFQPTILDELNAKLKRIENDCGRTPTQVAMDLDILAVYDDTWHITAKRLPFKAHEKAGLEQVADFLLPNKMTDDE